MLYRHLKLTKFCDIFLRDTIIFLFVLIAWKKQSIFLFFSILKTFFNNFSSGTPSAIFILLPTCLTTIGNYVIKYCGNIYKENVKHHYDLISIQVSFLLKEDIKWCLTTSGSTLTFFRFCVMLQTKFKCEKKLSVMPRKICKREVWFLYIVLFLIKIYLPVKFLVDNSDRFCVMLWTEHSYMLWNHLTNWSRISCGTTMR